MIRLRLAFGVLLLLAGAARADDLVTLQTRPGVTQGFYVTRPVGPPVASLLLFTGRDGLLPNPYRAANLRSGNFLIRARELFTQQGFLVAAIDAPSDQRGGLSGAFRLGAQHDTDIAGVVAWLRQASPAPVWLVGTSRGSVSAVNAAANVAGVHGLVLTSSVSRDSRGDAGNVFAAPLGRIAMPVLVINHRDDRCPVALPADAPRLLNSLSHAAAKQAMLFTGGTEPRSGPCEALAQHGYYGIEPQVVAAIGAWIKGH